MMMILDVLQMLLKKNVRVIAIKEGYELGDNIQSKVLAFAFGLSAEIEQTLLSVTWITLNKFMKKNRIQ